MDFGAWFACYVVLVSQSLWITAAAATVSRNQQEGMADPPLHRGVMFIFLVFDSI